MTARHTVKNILFRAILVITLAVLPLAKIGAPSFANGTIELSASSFNNPPPITGIFPTGGFHGNQEIASLVTTKTTNVEWHSEGMDRDKDGIGDTWRPCYDLASVGTKSKWKSTQWVCYYYSTDTVRSIQNGGVAINWSGGSPLINTNSYSSSLFFRELIAYEDKRNAPSYRIDEIHFMVTHRLYAPMWYGGFYFNGNNKIEACAIVSNAANEEFGCVSFHQYASHSHWMTGLPLGNSYRFSENPVSINAFRIFGRVGTAATTIIVPPYQQLGSSLEVCHGVNAFTVLVLKDRAVPAFTINGFGLHTNPSAAMFLESEVDDSITNHPFSCAGPVLQNNNRMIMPPGCGIKEDGKANLYFGTFRRSGSLRQFYSESDLRNLSKYKQNNRAMVFQYGGRSIESDTAILLVAGDANGEWLPLTIIVPKLTTDFSVYASKIFVARTDTGRVAVVNVNPSGPTTIVVAPEVVREVAQNRGEIVVRAVAVADRGSGCGVWNTRVHRSGEINYDFSTRACFDNAPNIMERVRNGTMSWFTPVAAVTSYSRYERYEDYKEGQGIERRTKDMTFSQDSYYRFAGDVAQASIRLIPVQSRVNMIGEEDIRIALQPNLPQVSRNYVQAGGDIWVGTDVHINPWVYARRGTLQISYVVTYTDPVSGTMVYSGTMRPDAIEITGTIKQPDGVYRQWSGSDKIILNRGNSYLYESPLGWEDNGRPPCYMYDDRRCRPRTNRIDGELQITATAVITISSSEMPEGIPVQLSSTKTIRPYWNVLYFEETR